jgi:Domain of unknown function (DUF5134)
VTGPAWVADTLAVCMLAVGGYCASRIVLSRLRDRRTDARIDLLHAAMGFAMVGMLAPRLAVLSPGLWQVVFAVGGVGLLASTMLGRARAVGATVGHDVPHAVMAAAMVYMLSATASRSGATGPSGTSMETGSARTAPTVALLLVVFMVGYCVVLADRLSPPQIPMVDRGARTYGQPGDVLAPRSSLSCIIAMALTMAYMLVLMI